MARGGWIAGVIVIVSVVAAGWSTRGLSATDFGFVDIERVFDDYSKNAELSKRLKADFDKEVAEMDKEKKRIDLRKEELQLLARDSQRYLDLKRTIDLDEYRMQLRQKEIVTRLERKKIAGWKELYADVCAAAERVARARGLTAVLVRNIGELEGSTDQEVMSQISLRQVLYADSSQDVTEEMLRTLNQ